MDKRDALIQEIIQMIDHMSDDELRELDEIINRMIVDDPDQ